MNKWIYVIAPTRQCFIRWCDDNDRHPNEKELVHVRTPLTMLGRRIKDEDEIRCFNIGAFDPKVFKEIEFEIIIRKMKCSPQRKTSSTM